MNHNEKILKSLIKNKPSPLLLEESTASFTMNFIYDFMKSICCTKAETFCNTCEACWKITRGKYFDFHLINTYKDSIHKEDLLSIINKLSYPSIEKYGNKFLIIYGIENVNKQIANMLLKNIENPSKNTYYIFVTRNHNNIINTIKSRCVFYKIISEEKRFIKELESNKIDQRYFSYFLLNFYSIDEVLDFYNNETFSKIVNVYETLINDKNKLISIHKSLISFKTFSYYEIAKLLFLLEPKVSPENKEKIYHLISSLKYNLNKTLVFNEILSMLK